MLYFTQQYGFYLTSKTNLYNVAITCFKHKRIKTHFFKNNM